MTKTKEENWLSILYCRVHNFNLTSDTWEFNRNAFVKHRRGVLRHCFSPFKDPDTDVFRSLIDVYFQMPASSFTVECLGKDWNSFALWHCQQIMNSLFFEIKLDRENWFFNRPSVRLTVLKLKDIICGFHFFKFSLGRVLIDVGLACIECSWIFSFPLDWLKNCEVITCN